MHTSGLSRHYARQHADHMKVPQPTEEQLAERETLVLQVESHCNRVLEFDPQDVNANNVLARISLGRRDIDAATTHLAHVVEHDQNTRVLYSQLLAGQGKQDEAEKQARLAVEHHSEALDDDLSDEQAIEMHRLQLASALAVLKDFKKAGATLLVDGKLPESPAQKQLLAQVMIAWSDQERGDTPESIVKKMNLLEQALRLMPNHPELIARLGKMATADGKAGDWAQETLKRILASGQASWIAHFALGARAYKMGDLRSAETHFEQAYRINPDTLVTMNNLAYMTAHREQPDFERALQLINKAIDKDPGNPEYRDTRGAIHVQMKRWDDAIADFEYSLKQLPGRQKTHEALAKAYQAKGDEQLAGIHREAAESLMSAQQ